MSAHEHHACNTMHSLTHWSCQYIIEACIAERRNAAAQPVTAVRGCQRCLLEMVLLGIATAQQPLHQVSRRSSSCRQAVLFIQIQGFPFLYVAWNALFSL